MRTESLAEQYFNDARAEGCPFGQDYGPWAALMSIAASLIEMNKRKDENRAEQ